MLVFPGGGYHFVSTHSEGLITAMWLNANGIAAFVCNYRCRTYKHPVPFWDAQRAMRIVRSRAAEFGVRADRIDVRTPPAFLAHAKSDPVVKVANSTRYHEALKARGVATELLLLNTGTHGGVSMDGKPAVRASKEHFADAFLKWLKKTQAAR